MFTLRRISGQGVQMNEFIGDGYTLIHKVFNPGDFNRMIEHHFTKPSGDAGDEHKNVYAFVVNGSFVQPLYKNQQNYIMASNGQTFDNLSFK